MSESLTAAMKRIDTLIKAIDALGKFKLFGHQAKLQVLGFDKVNVRIGAESDVGKHEFTVSRAWFKANRLIIGDDLYPSKFGRLETHLEGMFSVPTMGQYDEPEQPKAETSAAAAASVKEAEDFLREGAESDDEALIAVEQDEAGHLIGRSLHSLEAALASLEDEIPVLKLQSLSGSKKEPIKALVSLLQPANDGTLSATEIAEISKTVEELSKHGFQKDELLKAAVAAYQMRKSALERKAKKEQQLAEGTDVSRDAKMAYVRSLQIPSKK